jgi:hypothetical protein
MQEIVLALKTISPEINDSIEPFRNSSESNEKTMRTMELNERPNMQKIVLVLKTIFPEINDSIEPFGNSSESNEEIMGTMELNNELISDNKIEY